ncbi:MAG: ribosomal subunit interface protein [Candidatus Nealsonbacteria bacterium RIFOXYD1_FULL_39_11]|nr:MAG: ribosomal subunit interface protein [Candidatus Nealsonbacteria bacterium RIFOXYD1_FULL_39_11]
MKINTKATGISLTPAITEYIEKKINMLDKFFRSADEVLVNVEVGRTTKHHKSGDIFRAEIHITANGQEYYSVAETEDLYAAIDEVKDEIVYKLSSKRKKAIHLFRRGGAQIKNLLKGIKSHF